MAAVGQARKKTEGGSAGRLAAGRRPARGDDEPRSKSAASSKKGLAKGKKGKKGKLSANPIARLFKLIVLLGFMAVMGFALVLIADVGASLVGNVKFGDITFRDLVDKVSDRVLDRDVPEPKKKPAPKVTPAPTTKKPSSSSTTPSKPETPEPPRAPLQAPSPEDYARHVEPRVDPEVEQARARLDALLNR